METIELLAAKDYREAAKNLSLNQVRYLVDFYYLAQENRKRADNQILALEKSGEPADTIKLVAGQSRKLEEYVRRFLQAFVQQAGPVAEWCLSVKGIGPVITSGLLSHIDITKAPTVSHIYRFAGLDPSMKWEKGQKRPWNASLKTLCVKPGCYVTTRRGPIIIEDVQVGDQVLTHLGRWRAVTKRYVNDFDGDLVGLRSANGGNQIAWLTLGHPVFAASVQTWQSGRTFKTNEQTREGFDWHPVEAIAPRWLLQRPRVPLGNETVVLRFEGVEVSEGMVAAAGRWAGVAAPRARPIPKTVEVDADVGRLAGLYIAEGHRSGNYIGWSFHEDETELIRFTIDVLRGRFGIEPFVQSNKASRSIQVMVGSKLLAEVMAGLFGSSSHDAVLPASWLNANEAVRRGLWTGVMDGDGDHVGYYQKRRITTINPVLARQIVDLGRQLGQSVSLHQEPISGACRIHVNERLDVEPSARMSLSASYHGPVYNLEVEEDASYLVEGYAVHNCWKIGESFVKVSGNPDSLYGRLYLERKAMEAPLNEAGDYQEQAEAGAKRVKKTTKAYKSYAEGKLPDGHLHARAKRYAVKIFLSHLQAQMYREHYGEDPPKPYPIAILGHAHEIMPEAGI